MERINPKKITSSLISFLKNTFKGAGFKYAVIALSGGVDSSVSCALAIYALGKEKVFPVLLPYGTLNKQGLEDALKVIKILDIPHKNTTQIDIQPLIKPIFKLDPSMNLIRRGNIMARMRMILLFDLAKKYRALVVGTENKSEYLLGYYTRFGDEASDIEPLRNLYKTHVYQLAEFLQLPKFLLTKKPSANLWENQTDEGEFGFTYEDADKILYYYFDKNLPAAEIIKKGLKKDTVRKVLKFVNKNDFKHHLPFEVSV